MSEKVKNDAPTRHTQVVEKLKTTHQRDTLQCCIFNGERDLEQVIATVLNVSVIATSYSRQVIATVD